jgi:hypothetical protein
MSLSDRRDLRNLAREGEIRGGRRERKQQTRGGNKKASLEHVQFPRVFCAAEAGQSLPKLNRAGGRIGSFRGRIGGGPTPVSPHSSVFLPGKTGSVK